MTGWSPEPQACAPAGRVFPVDDDDVRPALYQRERTGMGTALDVSLFDALGEWMGYPAYYTAYSGRQPARTGASNAVIAPYGPFHCAMAKRSF